MINLLIKKFIKNYDNIDDAKVRNSYGYLAGIVGIIFNILLFVVKLFVGLVTSSIAITADAFNNLSDALSSIVTIVGFKLSSMPADKEHPYGHGRVEYIAALIVSFMVIIVGIEFTKSSIVRIFNPSPVKFELIPFILLILTIFVKIWLSLFNKKIGDRIGSAALKAAALDALGDIFTSTCVAISLLVSKFTDFPIDAYVGVVVSLIILYSGIGLIRETISPLLGEAPDPNLVEDLTKDLLSYKYICGTHDLMIHNYGVGKTISSVHIEFPANVDIIEMHNVVDKAEREISEKYNMYLTIHMDPIYVATGETALVKQEIEKIIEYNPILKSMHDFRIIECQDRIDLRFDVVIHAKKAKNVMTDEEIVASIKNSIEAEHPNYRCIITIDHNFDE